MKKETNHLSISKTNNKPPSKRQQTTREHKEASLDEDKVKNERLALPPV